MPGVEGTASVSASPSESDSAFAAFAAFAASRRLGVVVRLALQRVQREREQYEPMPPVDALGLQAATPAHSTEDSAGYSDSPDA